MGSGTVRKQQPVSFRCTDCGRTLTIALAWIDPDGVAHCDDIAVCWALKPVKKEKVDASSGKVV